MNSGITEAKEQAKVSLSHLVRSSVLNNAERIVGRRIEPLTINHKEVIHRFNSYCAENKVGHAFEQMIQDCLNESLSEQDATDVIGLLIAEVAIRFAKHYVA